MGDMGGPKAAKELNTQLSQALAPLHSSAKVPWHTKESFPTEIPGLVMIKKKGGGPQVIAKHLLKGLTKRFRCQGH